MPCQNQGYVLDGFPKTYSQAKEMFGNKEEEDEEEEEPLEYDAKIMPGMLICQVCDRYVPGMEHVCNRYVTGMCRYVASM